MLILSATTHKLRLVTSSTADIDVLVSGADMDNTTPSAQIFDAFTELATITTATTTDICAVPAASHRKNIKHISIRNKHAATANDVTVTHDLSATVRELFKCTLAAGEELCFNDGVWLHFDVYGGVYGPQLPVASDTVAGAIEIASQAEMEAATDTTRAVTPGRMHFHPGVAKFWVKFEGNTTTINASYNVSSITDGTSEATVNINTDFSSTEWAVFVTGIGTASTVAAARVGWARTMAAGTVIVAFSDLNATPALADPTAACVIGFGDL